MNKTKATEIIETYLSQNDLNTIESYRKSYKYLLSKADKIHKLTLEEKVLLKLAIKTYILK